MLLAGLFFVAVCLTCTMFFTKSSMLGFACAIFWALAGGQAYTQSLVAWDLYFLVAFACLLGMVSFTSLAAFGLREKRDAIGEEEMEKGDGEYPDEGKGKTDMEFHSGPEETDNPSSKRTQALHDRADRRRSRR